MSVNELEKYLDQTLGLLEKLENQSAQEVKLNITESSKASHSNGYPSMGIIYQAKQIDQPTIKLLEQIFRIREEGLAKTRKGNLVAGKRLIQHAKQLLTSPTLNNEARLIAQTYQHAANAFLYYKDKAYPAAKTEMMQAILTHEQLQDKYEHEFGARRIHLARNIIRALKLEGAVEKSFKMTCSLILYTLDPQQEWPFFDHPPNRRTAILTAGQWFVLEQLLGEIIYTLQTDQSLNFVKDHLQKLIIELEQLKTKQQLSDAGVCTFYWIKSQSAILNNNLTIYFDATDLFLKTRSGYLDSAFQFTLGQISQFLE